MHTLKIILLKLYSSLTLMGTSYISWAERIEQSAKCVAVFAPIAFILSTINAWYMDNQGFFYAVFIIVVVNMLFGGWVHWKKDKFSFQTLLNKTGLMLISLFLVYTGLEMVISHGGNNQIIEGIRAALQMSTLLYPFSKIAKNVFILTKGEYPPAWLMKKMFKFEQNGDLKEFFNTENQGK